VALRVALVLETGPRLQTFSPQVNCRLEHARSALGGGGEERVRIVRGGNNTTACST
jgi:hypothetical protein